MDVNGKNEIHYLWISCLLFFPTCPPLKVWHPSCLPCAAAAAARSLQSCPTLCNSIDGSPPGSSIPGILRARTLEWVAIFFSNAWKWKVKVKLLSHVQLIATPWTSACQAPLPMGFSRQEYWSGLPFSSPGDLPDPGVEPKSLASPVLEGGFFTIAPPGKPKHLHIQFKNVE